MAIEQRSATLQEADDGRGADHGTSHLRLDRPPAAGRTTIVITRNPNWSAEGVERAESPEEALR